MLTFHGTLTGTDACLRKLQGLRNSVQRRIIRKGTRAAVQVAARRGRSQVPVGQNRLLRKSLGWKLLKGRPGIFTAAGLVGPRTKVFLRVINGKRVDPGKYGHLVHGGTQAHAIRGNPRLAFTGSNGRRVVVGTVSHPGARRTGFLDKVKVTNTHGMASAFRGKVQAELLREAAKAKPSEVDDGT